jgi:hypothetical protein
MTESRSTLLRSTFLNDFGSETLRSAFSGRRESLRLFSATPPAIPAMAAPPATSGVFAFEASSATLLPAFETAPFCAVWFCAVWRALVPAEVPREADVLLRDDPDRPPVEPLRLELDRDLPEEPFLLVALFELERLRVDRLLEDRVVWAMVIASLIGLASLPATPFAAAVHLDLPAVQGFELPLL